MTPNTTQKERLSRILISRWEQAGEKLAALAREFPEEKYESVPARGARTFGAVIRHVAFWNHFVANSVPGKKADDTLNELDRTRFSTKAQIIDAVERSASDAVLS